jgi:uncharacterized membrane protein
VNLQNVVGRILQTGVILAAVVVLAGGMAYLAAHGMHPAAFHAFRGEPAELRSLGAIVRGVTQWNSLGIIQFGLVILIATPIARVAFSLVAFALERDRTYVLITLVVLAVLLYSLIAGQ